MFVPIRYCAPLFGVNCCLCFCNILAISNENRAIVKITMMRQMVSVYGGVGWGGIHGKGERLIEWYMGVDAVVGVVGIVYIFYIAIFVDEGGGLLDVGGFDAFGNIRYV